jgi:phosphocarrier protein HPr
MVQQEVIITNTLGIHARPAALIVQEASKFAAESFIEKDGMSANAKSIMSVMMLAAACNSSVIIKTSGKDEQQALEALIKLFANKFNE